MKWRNVIALVLVGFAFKSEIVEYGGGFLQSFSDINSVVELDKPEQDNLDLVNSTQLDDREYTKHDAIMLAVFHDKLADDLRDLDVESVKKQDLIDHHIKTLNEYLKSNKVEKKYDGLSDDIGKIIKDSLGDVTGTVDKRVVREYAQTCRAIAWSFMNRG